MQQSDAVVFNSNVVVFRMAVNHAKVQESIEELENDDYITPLDREARMLRLLALDCSDVIYVPETELSRYIYYCKSIS